jgi:mono/diheme cytochrome c family protein
MNRAFRMTLVVFVASSCTGAISDAPPDFFQGAAGAGVGGIYGNGTAGSGLAGSDPSGSAGVSGNTGAAGIQVTSTAGTIGTGTGGSSTGGGCSSDSLPADVQSLFETRCTACHGNPPIAGVPSSLTSYTALTAPSKTDPTKTVAQLTVIRMQSTSMPMPPAPLPRATTAEISTIEQWVAAGTPQIQCAGGTDGGAVDAGPLMPDPFAVSPVCTSKQMWTGGNRGSSSMNPGVACIACHSLGRGPSFALAGTLYPTAHEPDLCNGVNGNSGAQVVITGADGHMVTLTPNSAGNFSYQGTTATPYQAKVVYMGRERAMIEAQTSGDCNNCHTQDGAMPSGTIKAPGRILLP